MPVVINEIVIKTNVEKSAANTDDRQINNTENSSMEEIVKQSVEKVLEILEEKKQR